MIAWIKKEATGRPNDQRAEIIEVKHHDEITVRMLGDGSLLIVKYGDICGVELSENLSVMFRTIGFQWCQWSTKS